jgi:hypothetical protein
MKFAMMIWIIPFLLVGCGKDSDSSDDSSDVVGEAMSASDLFFATITWDPVAPKAGNTETSTAHVMLKSPDKELFTGVVSLDAFRLDMPAMGHGTNEDDQKIMPHEEMVGHFMVTGIHFSMAGEEGGWVANIAATVDGKSDTAKILVPAVN